MSKIQSDPGIDDLELPVTPSTFRASTVEKVMPEVIGPFSTLPNHRNTTTGTELHPIVESNDLFHVYPNKFEELSPSAKYNISWYMKVLLCTKDRIILRRFPWRNYWVMFLFIFFGVAGYIFIPSTPRDPKDNSPVITLHSDWPTLDTEWTVWRYIVYYYQQGKPFSIHKFAYLIVWVLAGILQAYPVEIAIFDKESGRLYTISQYPFPFSYIIFGLRYIKNWLNGCILKNPNPPEILSIPINQSADFRSFDMSKITDVFTQSYDKVGSAWRVSLMCDQFPIYLTDLTVNDYSLSGEFAHDLASFLRSWLALTVNLELDDYLSRIQDQRIAKAEEGAEEGAENQQLKKNK